MGMMCRLWAQVMGMIEEQAMGSGYGYDVQAMGSGYGYDRGASNVSYYYLLILYQGYDVSLTIKLFLLSFIPTPMPPCFCKDPLHYRCVDQLKH